MIHKLFCKHHKSNVTELGHNSADYLHVLLEALRQSFADGGDFIADPATTAVPVTQMLDPKRGKLTADRIQLDKYAQSADISSSILNNSITHVNCRTCIAFYSHTF